MSFDSEMKNFKDNRRGQTSNWSIMTSLIDKLRNICDKNKGGYLFDEICELINSSSVKRNKYGRRRQSCPHFAKNGWIMDGLSLNRWFYGERGGKKKIVWTWLMMIFLPKYNMAKSKINNLKKNLALIVKLNTNPYYICVFRAFSWENSWVSVKVYK